MGRSLPPALNARRDSDRDRGNSTGTSEARDHRQPYSVGIHSRLDGTHLLSERITPDDPDHALERLIRNLCEASHDLLFFNDRMVAAMITLGEAGRINLYQLAKKSHTNRTYIGHLVKRLEGLGLVEIGPVDGRKPVFVEATEKGKRVAALLGESSHTIWEEIAKGGSVEQGTRQILMELSSKHSLTIREAIGGYNLRITNSEGTFSLNIGVDRSKIEDLSQQLSSMLKSSATRPSSTKPKRPVAKEKQK